MQVTNRDSANSPLEDKVERKRAFSFWQSFRVLLCHKTAWIGYMYSNICWIISIHYRLGEHIKISDKVQLLKPTNVYLLLEWNISNNEVPYGHLYTFMKRIDKIPTLINIVSILLHSKFRKPTCNGIENILVFKNF